MTQLDTATDLVWLPRKTLRLPVELRAPDGFAPEVHSTWPSMDGRLEYVDGRLLYMPPCGELQQDVSAAVVGELYAWAKSHPGLRRGRQRGGDDSRWRRTCSGRGRVETRRR